MSVNPLPLDDVARPQLLLLVAPRPALLVPVPTGGQADGWRSASRRSGEALERPRAVACLRPSLEGLRMQPDSNGHTAALGVHVQPTADVDERQNWGSGRGYGIWPEFAKTRGSDATASSPEVPTSVPASSSGTTSSCRTTPSCMSLPAWRTVSSSAPPRCPRTMCTRVRSA